VPSLRYMRLDAILNHQRPPSGCTTYASEVSFVYSVTRLQALVETSEMTTVSIALVGELHFRRSAQRLTQLCLQARCRWFEPSRAHFMGLTCGNLSTDLDRAS
jgi:hypothetical protein